MEEGETKDMSERGYGFFDRGILEKTYGAIATPDLYIAQMVNPRLQAVIGLRLIQEAMRAMKVLNGDTVLSYAVYSRQVPTPGFPGLCCFGPASFKVDMVDSEHETDLFWLSTYIALSLRNEKTDKIPNLLDDLTRDDGDWRERLYPGTTRERTWQL